MIQTIQNYLSEQSLIEIFGVITGLICVYLAAINHIFNWAIGIVNLILYGIIFYNSHLYADMILQFYFLITSIYGWYYWLKKDKNENKTKITNIKKIEIAYSGFFITIFTCSLGIILDRYTNAAFPYIDSFCTSLSFVGQYFLARKVIENWLIWLFVDIIYVIIYFVKHLELTSIMYIIYMVIVIKGYFDWKKQLIHL